MADATSRVELLLQAKDETAPAFESLKARLEGVKSLFEKAMIWQAGEMAFEKVLDGAKEFMGGLIGANAAVETLQTSLTALYGNATEASQAIEYMTQFSLKSPFAKADILAAGQQIASFGQDITQVLPALGNVAAVMGSDLPSAAAALERAIQTGSLRSLTSQLHITKAELVDFGAQLNKHGTLIASTILPAFEKLAASGTFRGGMAAQLNTFAGATQNLKNQFDNLMEIVGKPVFQVLEGELKNLVGFLGAHQADVNNFAQNLGNFFGWAAQAVAASFTYMGNAIAAFVGWFRGSALPAIETVVGTIAMAFDAGGWSGILALWGQAFVAEWAFIFAKLGSIDYGKLTTTIVTGIQNAAVGVNDWMDGTLIPWMHQHLDKHIQDWYDSSHGIKWANLSEDLDTGIWNGIKAAASKFNDFMQWFALELNKQTLAAFSQAGTWLYNIGRDIIQGLINGVVSMTGSFTDAIASLPKAGYDYLVHFFRIHSPSQLMFDMGVNIGLGLAEGIKSTTAAVAAAMGSLSEGVKERGLTAQEYGAQILGDLFGVGGTGGKDSRVGGLPSLANFNIPALTLPPVPALAKLPALAALAGGTGSGAGASGTTSSGRVPLGALGAQFMSNITTGAGLHGGSTPEQRLAERSAQAGEKQLSYADKQTNLAQESRDLLSQMLTKIDMLAVALMRAGVPGPVPVNPLQSLGVARPGRI